MKLINYQIKKLRGTLTKQFLLHLEYDLEGLEDKSKWTSDPSQILLSGKGACEGYAGLFETMCR